MNLVTVRRTFRVMPIVGDSAQRKGGQEGGRGKMEAVKAAVRVVKGDSDDSRWTTFYHR